jgi:ABC-type transporter Mla subunit MlaD
MAYNRTVKVWVLLVSLLAAAVVTGVVVWLLTAPSAAAMQTALATETSRTADLTAQIATLSTTASDTAAAAEAALAKAAEAAADASAAASAVAANNPPVSQPSLTTYAYIRKLTGPLSEVFTVLLDPFQIYTGAAATKYAKDNGTTVPSNGILIVNASTLQTAYPLSQTAKITAYTGGVGATTPLVIQPGKLQSWAADHTVIPGASSDMWQVTIKNGVITTIKMVVIAS